jgi:hypothetical protein
MTQAISEDWQEHLRPAESGTPAEQFCIWAMRLWWRGFPELDAVWPDLARGFQVCGVTPALEAWHRFCSTALAAAGQGAGVACLYCPRITPTEECLLAALSVASTGSPAQVERVLLNCVPPAAARLMTPHVMHFTRVVTHAGLQWPVRNSHSMAAFSQRLH